MKKYKSFIYIITAIIFILIGFLVSKGPIFLFLIVIFLIIFSFAVFIIAGIIDLFKRSNYYKTVGIAILYLVIIPISFVIFGKIENYNKGKAAEQIILQLDSIKETEGKYPLNLDNISAKSSFPEINYSIDTLYQEFELWDEIEGWNMKIFYKKNTDP